MALINFNNPLKLILLLNLIIAFSKSCQKGAEECLENRRIEKDFTFDRDTIVSTVCS